MTKDLALCVHGTNEVSRDKYCETFEFINKVADTLKSNIYKAKLWYFCDDVNIVLKFVIFKQN